MNPSPNTTTTTTTTITTTTMHLLGRWVNIGSQSSGGPALSGYPLIYSKKKNSEQENHVMYLFIYLFIYSITFYVKLIY